MAKNDWIVTFSLPRNFLDILANYRRGEESNSLVAKRLLIDYLKTLDDSLDKQTQNSQGILERLARIESYLGLDSSLDSSLGSKLDSQETVDNVGTVSEVLGLEAVPSGDKEEVISNEAVPTENATVTEPEETSELAPPAVPIPNEAVPTEVAAVTEPEEISELAPPAVPIPSEAVATGPEETSELPLPAVPIPSEAVATGPEETSELPLPAIPIPNEAVVTEKEVSEGYTHNLSAVLALPAVPNEEITFPTLFTLPIPNEAVATEEVAPSGDVAPIQKSREIQMGGITFLVIGEGITQSALGIRLDTHKSGSTVKMNWSKGITHFLEWSKKRDPQQKKWVKDGELFYEVQDTDKS